VDVAVAYGVSATRDWRTCGRKVLTGWARSTCKSAMQDFGITWTWTSDRERRRGSGEDGGRELVDGRSESGIE
jgi:hypothetical protein